MIRTKVNHHCQHQASTVASESAFSFSGRVISLRRTKLSPESVEMCICLKDYLDAAERIQHVESLEDENGVETDIHEEEVEMGMSSPLEED
ncbi:putative HAT dimerization domain, ribonuclease H-like superfamily [Helianthus annuus]|uniref:HAT dimerization domain, ribonuclease H-like superfamily n=1 Tax=Helianthus annuus TaxID=4232 RepID=A0A9K3JG05_HELAN|nr:putative HAT dimerization domain, ribonuclease H-like superfamily [Helianthus annuus]